MKRRIAAVVVCLSVLTGLFGCNSILDSEKGPIVTPHQEPSVTVSDSIIEASTFEELKADILGFISKYEDDGMIRVYSYDGDIEKDVALACDQVKNADPLGAYAVSELKGTATHFVSYYEILVNVNYKVTKEQMDAIIPVSTVRYLQADLQDMLAEYAPSTVVHTKGIVMTEEDAIGYVKQIYYDHPMDIVMLPVTTVDFYPGYGSEQIIVFTFGYTRYAPSTLKAMEMSLNKAVQSIAESVSGNDAAILLSFCQRLMANVEYDAYTPASGEYSDQNTAATAYGALINGSAGSEGYAMAYKALCDELGITCDVVLGELDGKPHAWNIVELDNNYYHIDVSMCDLNGISTAFLRNDAEMEKASYTWDQTKYEPCNGPMTYEEVAKSAGSGASST